MKRLPIWLRVVIVVIIVLVVLAWALPSFVSLDRFHAALVSQLSRATGRPVSAGAIHAHLLPSIGFSVDQLAIGNPKGFPRGDFVRAQSLRGGLAFWPLLRGQVRVTWLALVQPSVTLLANSRGQSNAQFSSRPASAPSGAAAPGVGAAIENLDLRGLEITSAQVLPAGTVAPPAFQISGLNLRLANLQLSGDLLRNLDAAANLAGLRLVLGGLAAPVAVRAGAVSLRAGALAGQCSADLGPAGQASLHFQSPNIERSPVDFAIHSADLRLDRLLAASGGAPAAPAAAAPPAIGKAASNSSAPLAQGMLLADRLAWGPYQATAARAGVRIFPDRIEIAPVNLNFAGGHVAASFVQGRRLAITLNANGIGLASLFPTDPTLARRLSGTGALNLSATGPSAGDLATGLAGTGQFQFTRIELRNSPAVKQLAQLATAAKLLGASVGSATGGDLPIGLLKGDLEIAHGRVASRLIQAQTGLGTVELTGSLGMNQTLDYTGTLHLGAQPKAAAPKSGAASPPSGGLLGALASALGGKPASGGLPSQLLKRALNLRFRVGGTLAQPRVAPLLR